MNDQFKKFKRKILLHAIIESVVAGFAAGLIVVAAMLLPLSLNGIYINAGIYVGAGVGLFVVVGLLSFLIQRPTDKKVARRLDRDLALNEKVQTMVQFRNFDDSIVTIQRDDTSSRLSAAGTKKIKFKKIWHCSAATVVAVGLFAGALSVAIINATPVEPIYSAENSTLTGLRSLINYVAGSSLDEEPKSKTLEELNNILDAIYDDETDTSIEIADSARVKLVTDAMVNIDAAIDEVISGETLGMALYNMSATQLLRELGIHVASLTSSTTYTAFTTLVDELDANNFAESTPDDVATLLKSYASQIVVAVSSTKIATDDSLYTYFMQFADGLASAAEQTVEGGDDALIKTMLNDARKVVSDSAALIRNEVMDQNSDRNTEMYVINRLQYLFEITDDQMPDIGELIEDVIPSSGSNNDDKENEGSNGGGAGRGDTLYGSDSLIFDYTTGDQVPYGEVYARYQSIITNLIQEGRITDDKYIDMIYNYLESLYTYISEE